MLLDNNSVFHRLPSNMDKKQILFLDGIRYSIEMANLAYVRLLNTLSTFQPQKENKVDRRESFTSAILDAWSIIDSVNRLRILLRQMPKMKQKLSNLVLFYKNTDSVGDLRNTIQHLNNDIETFLQNKQPIWGVINWVIPVNQKSMLGYICSLKAGTLMEGNTEFLNPLGETIKYPIDLVTLISDDKSACITRIMEHVVQLGFWLDSQLKHQFKDLPTSGSDIFASVELHSK